MEVRFLVITESLPACLLERKRKGIVEEGPVVRPPPPSSNRVSWRINTPGSLEPREAIPQGDPARNSRTSADPTPRHGPPIIMADFGSLEKQKNND